MAVGTYYSHGIRLRSGQASTVRSGTFLRVVTTRRAVRNGEVHVDTLAVGEDLVIAGLSRPLRWAGRSKQARHDRRFDAGALQAEFADEYPTLLEIAVGNLHGTQLTESSAYARAVADAYLDVAPVVGLQTALYEHQAVAWAVSVDKLVEKLHHNTGAITAIAISLARHADSNDRTRMLQIARLLQHCDSVAHLDEQNPRVGLASHASEALAWQVVGSVLDARYDVVASAVNATMQSMAMDELGVVTWVGVLRDGRVLRYCTSARDGHAVGPDDEENLQWFASVEQALTAPSAVVRDELGELIVRAERQV